LDPNIAFLGSSVNNLLVCGILKGLNESFKQTFIGTGQKHEVKEVEFHDIAALDPELFA
jgi:hypothetical protein